MKTQRDIMKDAFRACLPVFFGFLLGGIFCLLIALCSCRSQKAMTAEAVKHVHDTTTVHDTTVVERVITNNIIQHDSIITRQNISASMMQALFDSLGNLQSVTNYTYNVNHTSQQGNELVQAASDSTAMVATHQQEAAHGEDSRDFAHQETKPMLSTTQKIFVVAGALALIAWLLFFAYKLRPKND